MNKLTDKQKELLLSNKEDLKAIVISLWKTQPLSFNSTDEEDFDSFASQFERKVRFVTNGDGEEIFDGDLCTVIEDRYFIISSFRCGARDFPLDGFTYFKSKEKAESYITLNAKRLSVNDVLNIVVDKDFYRDKLISLVKSKQ